MQSSDYRKNEKNEKKTHIGILTSTGQTAYRIAVKPSPAHPARGPTQKSVTSFHVAPTVLKLWRENLDLARKVNLNRRLLAAVASKMAKPLKTSCYRL